MKNKGVSISSPARAPKAHQRIGSLIYFNLENELADDENLMVIHEANSSDEDMNSLAPDVNVFDEDEVPVVSFQVCKKSGLKLELKKLNQLFEYGTEEVFIFVYKGDAWEYEIIDIFKFTPDGEDSKNAHYSDILDMEINEELAY
jgi:hypothetical protein